MKEQPPHRDVGTVLQTVTPMRPPHPASPQDRIHPCGRTGSQGGSLLCCEPSASEPGGSNRAAAKMQVPGPHPGLLSQSFCKGRPGARLNMESLQGLLSSLDSDGRSPAGCRSDLSPPHHPPEGDNGNVVPGVWNAGLGFGLHGFRVMGPGPHPSERGRSVHGSGSGGSKLQHKRRFLSNFSPPDILVSHSCRPVPLVGGVLESPDFSPTPETKSTPRECEDWSVDVCFKRGIPQIFAQW